MSNFRAMSTSKFHDDLGERLIAKHFDVILDDSWCVYHHICVPNRASFGKEMDFILAHPEHGMLGVEVKFWKAVDIINGKTISTPRNDLKKDAMDQAGGYPHAIMGMTGMPSGFLLVMVCEDIKKTFESEYSGSYEHLAIGLPCIDQIISCSVVPSGHLSFIDSFDKGMKCNGDTSVVMHLDDWISPSNRKVPHRSSKRVAKQQSEVVIHHDNRKIEAKRSSRLRKRSGFMPFVLMTALLGAYMYHTPIEQDDSIQLNVKSSRHVAVKIKKEDKRLIRKKIITKREDKNSNEDTQRNDENVFDLRLANDSTIVYNSKILKRFTKKCTSFSGRIHGAGYRYVVSCGHRIKSINIPFEANEFYYDEGRIFSRRGTLLFISSR